MGSARLQLPFKILFFFILMMLPGAVFAGDFALQFDGIDDYVQVPSSSSLNFGTGDFSVEAWFKTSVSNSDDDFVSKYDDSIGEGWGVYLSAFNVSFWAGWGEAADETDTDYGDGLWHHAVAVREGTDLYIYVDGTLKAQGEDNPARDMDTSVPLLIGGLPDFDEYLDGTLDEIRLYSRALSATEIQEHYGLTYSNNTGLEALWHFNEGSGTTVADSSGNGNDGTIIDATWASGIVLPTRGRGVISHRPEVAILSPQKATRFSDVVQIKYEGRDENDKGGLNERLRLGLGETPVSLFYVEDVDITSTFSYFTSPQVRKKKLIVKDLPAIGTYEWDVSDLPAGDSYRILLEAVDNSTLLGPLVSEAFSIDHAAPVFTVRVEPELTQGEDVQIIVDSTEDVGGVLQVTVTQHGFEAVEVQVTGEKNHFEGQYIVELGFDGTALVTVSGGDEAGNTAVTTGTFNVVTKAPPRPIVTSPLDQDIITTETISIKGNARQDLTILLLVNGETEYQITPDEKGTFLFEDIPIDPDLDKGFNIFRLTGKDPAGNVTEATTLTLKFNFEPEVAFTSPSPEKTLSSKTLIEVAVFDRNDDTLSFTFELSEDKGETWFMLVKDSTEQNYLWNTFEFANGKYLLRATVSDGFTQSQIVSEELSLSNFVPTIVFPDKGRRVIESDTIVIQGTASTPLKPPKRFIVTNIEYSLNGFRWIPAEPLDGDYDSPDEEFSFVVENLKEDEYTILIRVQDNRGVYGRAKKVWVVDFGPPPAPTIDTPGTGEIFSYGEDLNADKAGIQIRVKGQAEPNNTVMIQSAEASFEGSSDNEGNFDIEVTLRERGEHSLSVSSVDPVGNSSIGKASVSVVNNTAPDLKILLPRKNRGIGGQAEVIFEIQDRDLDRIIDSRLSWRRSGSEKYNVLAQNMEEEIVTWDVTTLPEGKYELKLEANDGISQSSLVREFFIDNTEPTVVPRVLDKTIYGKSLDLETSGNATDNFSGIEYVEYSIDGQQWFKAVITGGYQTRQAAYRARHPISLEDGVYDLSFRATDVAGNVSAASPSQRLLVDTTSPRIGSYTVSVAGLLLFPQERGFKIPAGQEAKFTISLEQDVKSASLRIGSDIVELAEVGGVWVSEIPSNKIGNFPLSVSAIDLFENETSERIIGDIEIVPAATITSSETGQGIAGVEITILEFLKESQSWVRWQAESYGFANPIVSDERGSYKLLLPSGTYQILFESSGFQRSKTSTFEVSNPQFILLDFELRPRRGIKGILEELLERLPF